MIHIMANELESSGGYLKIFKISTRKFDVPEVQTAESPTRTHPVFEPADVRRIPIANKTKSTKHGTNIR